MATPLQQRPSAHLGLGLLEAPAAGDAPSDLGPLVPHHNDGSCIEQSLPRRLWQPQIRCLSPLHVPAGVHTLLWET